MTRHRARPRPFDPDAPPAERLAQTTTWLDYVAAERTAAIVELHAEGESMRSIAKAASTTHVTVAKVLRRAGVDV